MARIYARHRDNGLMYEVISFEWASIRLREMATQKKVTVSREVFNDEYRTSAEFLTVESSKPIEKTLNPEPYTITIHETEEKK